jgi:transposase InsO family protein
MKRQTSQAVIDRNRPLLEAIRQIKQEHPFWGYRRVWAYITYHKQIVVNKKRVYKIMKKNNLLVTKVARLRAKRTPMRSKPKAGAPNEIWGIDMTKIKIQEHGWAYIVLVLDWYSKKIVGTHVEMRSKTEDWLIALEDGLSRQCPNGAREVGLKLVSDNGCQPTSERFMKTCNTLGIKQIFTSYCNPKGNAETERMMRTMKEELLWLREWNSIEQVKTALTKWVKEYNESYLHSAHGYRPPMLVEAEFTKQEAA